MRIFYSGWMEYFGGQCLLWILFNLSRINQWFKYNSLRFFLGVWRWRGWFNVDYYFVVSVDLLLE
jgi:hypothetical protein